MKPSQERRAGRLFGPLAASMAELVSAYKDEEIELILDFLGRTRAMLQNRAMSLRSHRKRRRSDLPDDREKNLHRVS